MNRRGGSGCAGFDYVWSAWDGEGGFAGAVELLEDCGHAAKASSRASLVGGGHIAGCGGILAGAHEAVARAVIDDGLILFAETLHGRGGGGDRGTDAGVVAGVEAVDGGGDVLESVIRRRGAVEDEGCGEIIAMGGEGEGLAAAPAVAGDEELAVGGGDGLGVVGGGVEVGKGRPRGSRPETALVVASWLVKASEPPPLGPRPERRSGAMTM